MNQKHLSCVVLFAVIILAAQGILTLDKKRRAAEDAKDTAEGKLATATQMRTTAQIALTKTQKETAPLRKYFRMWLPEFEKSDSEIKAKDNFQRLVKRMPSLVMFDQGMNPLVPIKDGAFVVKRATGRARFEGDYHKSLQFLSMIERELSTSRISSVEIRKGQRANDVEVSVLVDMPVLAESAAPTP